MGDILKIETIEAQRNYLEGIRDLLNEKLKPDAFTRSEFYLQRIGTTSQFVYSWIEKSFSLMESVDSRVYLEEIKNKCKEQLELDICKYNIYLMKNGKDVTPQIFWLSKTKQISDKWFLAITNTPSSSQLLQASRHVEDLLFASRIISEDISEAESAKKFSEEELTPFIQNTLSEYLNLLTTEKSDTKEKIKQCFLNLRENFSNESFESANTQISELKILLCN